MNQTEILILDRRAVAAGEIKQALVWLKEQARSHNLPGLEEDIEAAIASAGESERGHRRLIA